MKSPNLPNAVLSNAVAIWGPASMSSFPPTTGDLSLMWAGLASYSCRPSPDPFARQIHSLSEPSMNLAAIRLLFSVRVFFTEWLSNEHLSRSAAEQIPDETPLLQVAVVVVQVVIFVAQHLRPPSLGSCQRHLLLHQISCNAPLTTDADHRQRASRSPTTRSE